MSAQTAGYPCPCMLSGYPAPQFPAEQFGGWMHQVTRRGVWVHLQLLGGYKTRKIFSCSRRGPELLLWLVESLGRVGEGCWIRSAPAMPLPPGEAMRLLLLRNPCYQPRLAKMLLFFHFHVHFQPKCSAFSISLGLPPPVSPSLGHQMSTR